MYDESLEHKKKSSSFVEVSLLIHVVWCGGYITFVVNYWFVGYVNLKSYLPDKQHRKMSDFRKMFH